MFTLYLTRTHEEEITVEVSYADIWDAIVKVGGETLTACPPREEGDTDVEYFERLYDEVDLEEALFILANHANAETTDDTLVVTLTDWGTDEE